VSHAIREENDERLRGDQPRNRRAGKDLPDDHGRGAGLGYRLAYETYQNWLRSSTVEERAKLVRRVGELHTERREQLAEITTREMGKPLEQALGEVDFCVDIYSFYAENGPDLMKDEPIELLAGEGSAIIRRSPYGVILGIMPWNFPTYQVARFAGPNLVIGNAVLLKHAPQCPETAAALQQIYLDAGFPEGAYVNIYATNEQIAQVIADPRVQGVSVTGSERAGAAVAEIAGETSRSRLGARRLRSVHPAQHRRHGCNCRCGGGSAPGQCRPIV
jgi:acyl-CoA reductase-like NAD-dependent aldehyde dehydrogenase